MSKKLTHIGVLTGQDSRVPSSYRREVKIRETKCYWITEHALKFSKKYNGCGIGDYPMYRLDMKSIKDIK